MIKLAPIAPLFTLVFSACSGKVIEASDPGPDPNPEPDLCAGIDCGEHGACDEGTCTCKPGYAGQRCESCAQGFEDPDGDGTCTPVPNSNPCDNVDCGAHGHCEAGLNEALCVCDPPYAGPVCSQCMDGYQDNDGDGSCAANCATAGLDCGHGSCSDATGTAACLCDEGWQEPECDTCLEGLQDNDGDGSCAPACVIFACGQHATCSDSSGAIVCTCDPGYVDDGAGNCVSEATGACASPIPLDLSAGSVAGTTLGKAEDFQGSCQSESSLEDVYRFDVLEPLRIRFHMSGFDTVLYVRADCDSASSEIACDDDGGPNNSSIIERDFQPGTYFLFADGWGTSAGPYTIDIHVECGAGAILDPSTGHCVPDPCATNPCVQPHMTQCEPVPPTGYTCHCDPGYIPDPGAPNACIVDPDPKGETCADPILLAPGTGSVQGTTSNASHDAAGSCGGQGPERIYVVSLSEPMRADLSLSGYDTVLYLRTACAASNTEVACNDDNGYSTDSAIITVLDPGDYYIFADSYSDGGGYTLDYDFRPDPCAGDPCPGVPECVASPDWNGYTCVCPAGTLPYGSSCVDDPCDPNPCLTGPDHRWSCDADLATGSHSCVCNPGYMDDPSAPNGACILDPDANEWAFIVYINGDNNLESDAFDDLEEMAAAGSTDDVHIVVLLDTYSQGNGHARKLYVTQGGYDELENLGEVDMGDWQTLADFGVWAVQNYPARHHALVLWNHGDGWKHQSTNPLSKGFSTDDHGNPDGISISSGDYARALQEITTALGNKLDFVGFDACLMGMWEVADASAPYANVLVASEETIPLSGWSYDDFLVPLVATPEVSAQQLGTWIIDTYHDEDSDNSTLSMVDLTSTSALRTSISGFADALRADPSSYNKVANARNASQSFSLWEHRDLWDFANRVSQLSGVSPELVAASQSLKAQIETSVLHSAAQTSYPGAHGLAIYLPGPGEGMDQAYTASGATWSQATTWDEFLASFVQ